MNHNTQYKLTKYESKLKDSNNNETYKTKYKIYSNLCNDNLTYLKFYLLVIKFLDAEFIKYISQYNKKENVFDQIKKDFNFKDLQIEYTDIYNNFDFLKNVDNIIKELISDLSFKNNWGNAISKIIMLKILFLYEFNANMYLNIKEFCQNKIDKIIF